MAIAVFTINTNYCNRHPQKIFKAAAESSNLESYSKSTKFLAQPMLQLVHKQLHIIECCIKLQYGQHLHKQSLSAQNLTTNQTQDFELDLIIVDEQRFPLITDYHNIASSVCKLDYNSISSHECFILITKIEFFSSRLTFGTGKRFVSEIIQPFSLFCIISVDGISTLPSVQLLPKEKL